MIYKMTGTPTHIRVLSLQLTGHVVWLSQEPLRGMIPNSRVPLCVPGLDYMAYTGPGPDSIPSFYGALKHYKLVCSMSQYPVGFETEALPFEFTDRIKLYRVKCYAIQSIQNTVGWAMEKNGLYMNPVVDSELDFDRLSEIHQRQHNLTKPVADKLLQFKFDEHRNGLETLKYVQIETELEVTNATSVLEVSNIYKKFLTSIGMVRSSDESIMRLM